MKNPQKQVWNKISPPPKKEGWLNFHYERLRDAHSSIKDILYSEQYDLTPDDYQMAIEAISEVLYIAESIAVKQDDMTDREPKDLLDIKEE